MYSVVVCFVGLSVLISLAKLKEHVATVGEIKHWRTLFATEVEKEGCAKADAGYGKLKEDTSVDEVANLQELESFH